MNRISTLWPAIESTALRLGAMRAGVSGVEDLHAGLFDEWIAAGRHASMNYLAKNRETRRSPLDRFPWARSVVVITVPYSPERVAQRGDAIGSRIARYALGDDYHDVLDRMLRDIEEVIRSHAPDTMTRRYVDTGPLSDRAYGSQAGLGWIGKNGMLIDEEKGSYFFIGTLLTSLENDLTTAAVADRCGACTRCLDACPTVAILPDRTVDSTRCLSHANIELRGPIPDSIKERLGGNLFGCDICQEVCPWNEAPALPHPAFLPREEYSATPVTDLLRADQTAFSSLFRKSAIKRAKHAGIVRNAVIVTRTAEAPDSPVANDPGVADALEWARGKR